MLIESIFIVIVINALGLSWCYIQQSDKVTDLFYSLSFIVLTSILWFQKADSLVHHFVFFMVSLWGLRLGGYLFKRIHTMGKDDRFDRMRQRFIAIAGFWFLQAMSILILVIPIIIVFTKPTIILQPIHIIGMVIWLIGLTIETVADQQKFTFRQNKTNDGSFIQTGLWKRLQHPNYLGEILCWIGLFIVAIPSLEGWEWLSIISPIWISLLLCFISGIPLLQKASQKKYGHLVRYQNYQKNTSFLIPFLY